MKNVIMSSLLVATVGISSPAFSNGFIVDHARQAEMNANITFVAACSNKGLFQGDIVLTKSTGKYERDGRVARCDLSTAESHTCYAMPDSYFFAVLKKDEIIAEGSRAFGRNATIEIPVEHCAK